MQEPGSVPGFFEEEAIACASSALQLSSLPGDQCQAHLALGKAQVALYHLKVGGGQAAADLAWPGASEGGVTPNAVRGTDTVKVILACCRRVNAAGYTACRQPFVMCEFYLAHAQW